MQTRLSTRPWYVVYCQPRKEAQVAQLLNAALEGVVYAPEVRYRVRGEWHQGPLFPRYVFVQAGPGVICRSVIETTPGAIRVLADGARLQTISAAAVETLRARVTWMNEHGGVPNHAFEAGERVRLTAGPLQGLEALFVGVLNADGRVRVLLDFLGRPNEVVVDGSLLEATSDAGSVRRLRRTRGRGRVIHATRPAA
ncbi:MAG TPA: transcription termination/antitermination NusG family protein [Chloroflexia bacterium]|nr:transcription termination/antitermination NusG family protein [Chloroflexia bacterium]